jgi:hypothetical protein
MHIPAAVPDRCLGVDFDFALLPAVPMFDLGFRLFVLGSSSACCEEGRREPFTHGRPYCPAFRPGAGS